jgi:hypothetical protein
VQDCGDTFVFEAVILSDRLSAAGSCIYAFYANSWVGELFGVDQNFKKRLVLPTRSDRLTRRLLAHLARLAPEDQLFAYIHTIDPHTAYEPTPADQKRFASPGSALGRVSAVVEDTAARARRGEPASRPDRGGRRLTTRRSPSTTGSSAASPGAEGCGLYDESLVVFTSDHGEELDHGGVSHGHTPSAKS